MCTVSMVMEHYTDKWQPHYLPQWPLTHTISPGPSRAEFDELRRDVNEMKALLIKAKAYDEKNGEPDCEMADKVAIVKTIAEMVGVDLGDVLAINAIGA